MSKENAPLPPAGLTAKQQRFVAEYLIDLNATQAAIRAGYSASTANQQGPRLLVHVGIAAAVKDSQARQLAEAQTVLEAEVGEAHVDAVRVLLELGRLATLDMRTFYDGRGNLKPIHEWTATMGAAAASFEVIKKNAAAGDGVIDTIHKFKVWDKGKALETLAKHFGLLIEKLDVSGTIEIAWLDSES